MPRNAHPALHVLTCSAATIFPPSLFSSFFVASILRNTNPANGFLVTIDWIKAIVVGLRAVSSSEVTGTTQMQWSVTNNDGLEYSVSWNTTFWALSPVDNNNNKAGYTATPVACGWAGAIFEVSGAFGQERFSQKPHKRWKSKVWQTDGWTDGLTDGLTDQPTKRGVESRSTRLKNCC